MRKVCDFAGISPSFAPGFAVRNLSPNFARNTAWGLLITKKLSRASSELRRFKTANDKRLNAVGATAYRRPCNRCVLQLPLGRKHFCASPSSCSLHPEQLLSLICERGSGHTITQRILTWGSLSELIGFGNLLLVLVEIQVSLQVCHYSHLSNIVQSFMHPFAAPLSMAALAGLTLPIKVYCHKVASFVCCYSSHC